jgi:hypothetical protein
MWHKDMTAIPAAMQSGGCSVVPERDSLLPHDEITIALNFRVFH